MELVLGEKGLVLRRAGIELIVPSQGVNSPG
jgi:hypothetical protein